MKDKLSVHKILEEFTTSYINKTENPDNITFGYLVDDKDWWKVSIFEDGSFQVLNEKPIESTFYLLSNYETLKKIYTGKMHFMTAIGRANMSDKAPLDIGFLNGYQLGKLSDLLDFAFHYFVIGYPEKVLFGKEYARIIHDGYAVPLLYQDNLRTGWYRVEKGMIINENPEDQTNPFDTFVIGIKGKGIAKLNDNEYNFEEGSSFLIPKGMTHSFYTYGNDGLEFIIIMYGHGA